MSSWLTGIHLQTIMPFFKHSLRLILIHFPFCINAKFVQIPMKLSSRKVGTTIILIDINIGKYAEIKEKYTLFPRNAVRPNPINFNSEHAAS